MIGPLVTPHVGPLVGVSDGSLDQPIAVTWSVDATSGIGVPDDATEWGDMIAAYSLTSAAPSNLWLMQEASGDLVDSIGALTLPDASTVTYQNAITGWDRDAVGTADGTAGSFRVASGVGPNPSSTSVAALLYIRIDAAAAERSVIVFNFNAGDYVQVNVLASGVLRGYCDTNSTDGIVVYEGGSVFPLLMVNDRVNSRFRIYTDREKVSVTYGAVGTDAIKGFGGIALSPATTRMLYGAWWSGADAAALSTDATAKSMLEALGWTVTGY